MSRHARFWSGIALAMAVSGCADAPDPQPPNLVVISIDSLRADHLGCYGYHRDTSPFIDQLAAEGVRFATAVSTTSWTLPAHAAMFTGLYDSAHGLVDNGLRLNDGHQTLAELLRSRGYHTAGFFGSPYLHPTFGLHQGFDVYRSCMTTTPDDASDAQVRSGAQRRVAASHRDITGPRTRDEVTAWATSGVPEPYFLFVHLWDVHYDYIPPERYVRSFDPDYTGDLTGERVATNPRLVPGMPRRDLEHLVALYDGEIRFTDDILRETLGVLQNRGLLDDTLVVVTADHGEEFFEHGGKGHQRTLYDEVLRVPLIIHGPGIEGGRLVEDQVRLIDLMPTLLEIAGSTNTPPVQGRDLGPLLRGDGLPPDPALAELLVNRKTTRAIRTNDFKLIREGDEAAGRLYRLESDPRELRPVEPGSSGEGDRRRAESMLDQELIRTRAHAARLGASEAESVEVDEQLEERLRSLGYLGDE